MDKDPDIVLEEVPLIILDRRSDVCMVKNGMDSNQTRHIPRRVHFVSNGEIWGMNKINWRGGGLQWADIGNKHFGENDLNTRMEDIMVRLDNWYRKIVQKGWQGTG